MFDSGENDFLKRLYRHQWSLNKGENSSKETPEFWDSRAEDFAAKAHSQESRDEVLKLLKSFSWRKDETVLDVGAGPGTYAVPLAKMVASVTSTDVSEAMLAQLKLQAQKEGVNNIKTRVGRWLSLDNLKPHDTVMCFNSLGVISADDSHECHLDTALLKLRDLTKKRLLILIPHADSPADQLMKDAVGITNAPLERKRIAALYYGMIDCGMLPGLQILSRPFHWTFKDLNEAVDTLSFKLGLEESKKELLAVHLEKRLVSNGKNLSLSYKCAQALFVWDKDLQ